MLGDDMAVQGFKTLLGYSSGRENGQEVKCPVYVMTDSPIDLKTRNKLWKEIRKKIGSEPIKAEDLSKIQERFKSKEIKSLRGLAAKTKPISDPNRYKEIVEKIERDLTEKEVLGTGKYSTLHEFIGSLPKENRGFIPQFATEYTNQAHAIDQSKESELNKKMQSIVDKCIELLGIESDTVKKTKKIKKHKHITVDSKQPLSPGAHVSLTNNQEAHSNPEERSDKNPEAVDFFTCNGVTSDDFPILLKQKDTLDYILDRVIFLEIFNKRKSNKINRKYENIINKMLDFCFAEYYYKSNVESKLSKIFKNDDGSINKYLLNKALNKLRNINPKRVTDKIGKIKSNERKYQHKLNQIKSSPIFQLDSGSFTKLFSWVLLDRLDNKKPINPMNKLPLYLLLLNIRFGFSFQESMQFLPKIYLRKNDKSLGAWKKISGADPETKTELTDESIKRSFENLSGARRIHFLDNPILFEYTLSLLNKKSNTFPKRFKKILEIMNLKSFGKQPKTIEASMVFDVKSIRALYLNACEENVEYLKTDLRDMVPHFSLSELNSKSFPLSLKFQTEAGTKELLLKLTRNKQTQELDRPLLDHCNKALEAIETQSMTWEQANWMFFNDEALQKLFPALTENEQRHQAFEKFLRTSTLE